MSDAEDRPSPLDDPGFVAGLRPIPSGLPGEVPVWPAADLHGVRPDGSPVSVVLADLDRPLLLVFLAERCDGCESFWQGIDGGVADPALASVVPVVVTRGPDSVADGEVTARVARFGGVLVMSDRAWTDYRVTGYPFLVLVDPTSERILAESVGVGWDDVASTIRAGLGSSGPGGARG